MKPLLSRFPKGGKQGAQQAGPEQKARQHLAGHGGETEGPDDPGHDLRGDEDRDELVEQMEGDLLGTGSGTTPRAAVGGSLEVVMKIGGGGRN